MKATLSLLVASLLVLLASGRPWLVMEASDPTFGTGRSILTGGDLSGALPALGLLGAAAALLTLLTRGWSRMAGTVVGLLATGSMCWNVGSVLLDPRGAAAAALAGTGTGLPTPDPGAPARGPTGQALERLSTSDAAVWAWVALGAAVVGFGAGVVALVSVRRSRGRGSSRPSARRGVAPTREEQERRTAADVWDRLSRGQDPTLRGQPDDDGQERGQDRT